MGLRAELQFEIQAGSQKIPADTELEFLTENGANFENSSIRLQENIEPIQQTLISNRFRVPFCDVFDASVACHKVKFYQRLNINHAQSSKNEDLK